MLVLLMLQLMLMLTLIADADAEISFQFQAGAPIEGDNRKILLNVCVESVLWGSCKQPYPGISLRPRTLDPGPGTLDLKMFHGPVRGR